LLRKSKAKEAKVKTKSAHSLASGGRVYLSSPGPVDGAELIALNRASKNLHRNLASPPTTPKQFEQYLNNCRRDDFVGLLVRRKIDHAIIGVINLSQIFYGKFKNAYVGFYLGAAYVGQGYMAEAIVLTLKYAFKKLRLHRIEANIQPHNTKSRSLVKRAGFSLEGYSRHYLKIGGRWRDHERWAILAEDWRKAKTNKFAL